MTVVSVPQRSPAHAGQTSPHGGVGVRVVRALIRLYQVLRAGRPSPCRYLPTCSAYAAEALEHHGLGRGSWLALCRVLRCHPWGGSGHDPVPDTGSQR